MLGSRILHNDDLYDLDTSPELPMGPLQGASDVRGFSDMQNKLGDWKFLQNCSPEPEGKKPLGKHRWSRKGSTLIDLNTLKKYSFRLMLWMGFI